jgi:TRAP-type C4-dicarboxylate transport system permease small subunit
VVDAIAPYLSPPVLKRTVVRIASQLLVFTYAFWLIEFRKVQSWKYAAAVYRGLSPAGILKGASVSALQRCWIRLLYAAVGIGGLLMPVSLFQRLQPALYRLAKRRTAGRQ